MVFGALSINHVQVATPASPLVTLLSYTPIDMFSHVQTNLEVEANLEVTANLEVEANWEVEAGRLDGGGQCGSGGQLDGGGQLGGIRRYNKQIDIKSRLIISQLVD